jgi:hypothetical protein
MSKITAAEAEDTPPIDCDDERIDAKVWCELLGAAPTWIRRRVDEGFRGEEPDSWPRKRGSNRG